MLPSSPNCSMARTIQASPLQRGEEAWVGGPQPPTQSHSIFRSPAVVGQTQGVDDVPADSQLRQSGDGESFYHLVTEPEAPSRLRRESPGEALGPALPGLDIGAQ